MLAEMLEAHETQPVPISSQDETLFETRRCSFCDAVLDYIVAPDEGEMEAQERAIEDQGWGSIGRELACDRCLRMNETED